MPALQHLNSRPIQCHRIIHTTVISPLQSHQSGTVINRMHKSQQQLPQSSAQQPSRVCLHARTAGARRTLLAILCVLKVRFSSRAYQPLTSVHRCARVCLVACDTLLFLARAPTHTHVKYTRILTDTYDSRLMRELASQSSALCRRACLSSEIMSKWRTVMKSGKGAQTSAHTHSHNREQNHKTVICSTLLIHKNHQALIFNLTTLHKVFYSLEIVERFRISPLMTF